MPVYIGIDWSQAKHDVCFLDEAGEAIARMLLVVIWYVLTARAADRHADPELVAFKLMVWSSKLSDEQRRGLSTRQFVRYQLMHLGLGRDPSTSLRAGTDPQPALSLPKGRAWGRQAPDRARRGSARAQAGTGWRGLSRVKPQSHIARAPRRKNPVTAGR